MHDDNVFLPSNHSETEINLYLHTKLQFVPHSDLSLLPLESLVVYCFLFNVIIIYNAQIICVAKMQFLGFKLLVV